MHADGKSTLVSVSKWNSGKANSLGKCHFLPGGGLLKIGGSGIFLRSKGGIKRFFKIKKGDDLYFLKK